MSTKVTTFALVKTKYVLDIGEMAEWSIAAVLKTGVPQGTGGSNPSLSAKLADFQRVFFFTANFTAKKSRLHRESHTIKIAVNN